MAVIRFVYVVSGQANDRAPIAKELSGFGYRAAVFDTGCRFLADAGNLAPGCVLVDLALPEHGDLGILERLDPRLRPLFPVIAMTADADVAAAVRAMKAGACDFLSKPFDATALRDALGWGWTLLDRNLVTAREQALAHDSVARLSPRERDVLEGLTAGQSNKSLAHELQLSTRTIEMHRRRMMDRLNVASVSEAIRIAFVAKVQKPVAGGRRRARA